MRQDAVTLSIFATLALAFAVVALDVPIPFLRAPAAAGELCAAHGKPVATCDQCNPKTARGGTFTSREREPREGECPNTLVRITLAPEAVAFVPAADLHTVQKVRISETLRANAELRYPPDRYALVAPRIAGTIRKIFLTMGAAVDAGTPLAQLESPEYGQAKSAYLQALSVRDARRQLFEQEQALFEKKVTPERDYLEAKNAAEEAHNALLQAEQKLTWLGHTQEQIRQIAEQRDASPVFDITAPFTGTVIDTTAVLGALATPDKAICTVADGSRMWALIDVTEADFARVEKDQKVVFRIEGAPETRFPGKVVAVAGEVDDRTRCIRVYADLKNVGGLLRANMFGTAEIAIRPAEPTLLVPKGAVQNDGDCNLVFVSPTAGVFQARKIELGTAYDQGFAVKGGLAEGERVATTGSFLLKTEILRGQIGAG